MPENLLSSLSEETNKQMERDDVQTQPPEPADDALRKDLLSEDFRDQCTNIYEAIIVMSQRARQIGQKQARIIEHFMSLRNRSDDDDDDEEILRPSLEDDDDDSPRLPKFEKPTILAMNEMVRGEIKFKPEE